MLVGVHVTIQSNHISPSCNVNCLNSNMGENEREYEDVNIFCEHWFAFPICPVLVTDSRRFVPVLCNGDRGLWRAVIETILWSKLTTLRCADPVRGRTLV